MGHAFYNLHNPSHFFQLFYHGDYILYLPGVLWIILSALFLQVSIYLKERSGMPKVRENPPLPFITPDASLSSSLY